MGKLVVVLVVVTAAAAGAGALWPAPARAAVPTWTNPCSGDIDVAACERLTFLAETEDANGAKLDALLTGPLSITCDDTCATSTTEASLSDEDRHSFNLIWWGVWALVGLAFVSIIAAPWYRAWNIEGKLGRG